jgi:ribonucleoside-diphosphate reductase alpha chain
LSKHAYIAQKLCDDIVDLEIEKINIIIKKIENDSEPKNIKSVELDTWNNILNMLQKSRRTGLGFTGLADAIAAMGLQYGSKESIELVEGMQSIISKSSLNSSIDMAIDRGTFDGFDYDKEKDHEFLNRILDPNYAEKFKQYGRRNVSLTTIAPAGSISLLTRTASGFEPAFMIYYKRKRKINPNDKNVDLTKINPDVNGDMYEQYYVFHHKFIEWYSINQNISYNEAKEFLNNLSDIELNKLIEISPYYKSTAHEINWKDKIDLQAVLQKYISHSISSCVIADTLIHTNDGLFYIDELYDFTKIKINEFKDNDVLLSKSLNHLGEYVNITSFYNNGEKPVFKMELENGLKICCTGNEKFIVYNEDSDIEQWKMLSEINSGDLIKINT